MKSPASKTTAVVAQHNALVNARFSFAPMQMRLFIALLTRIDFNDEEFQPQFIPFEELLHSKGKKGGSSYEAIADMCRDIIKFTIHIEELEEETRKRRKKPVYLNRPLMAQADYHGEMGGVVASFNPLIMPYLLQLRESGNFTTAEVEQLRKLKSPYSLRIYFLLREYGDFGKRIMTIEQLRFALDIDEDEYREFKNLKARVLDKAQDEIAATDIPFTYNVERNGRSAKSITFAFPPTGTATRMTSIARPVWQQRLIESGVGNRSISTIEAQLNAGEYDEGYVEYVLRIVENQFRKGKIKKPAGAIYKALVEKYLLEDYRQAKVAPKPTRASVAKALPPAKAEEVAFRLAEVREMYDNPGPYAQRHKRAETFQEHLEQVYFKDGFTVLDRGGEKWLVKQTT